VALLLDEAALAGPEGVRVVLEGALPALVAHRAVERVVDEQELQDAVLGLLRARRLGVDDHAVGDGDHARRLQRRSPAGVDVDDAHPAHADRLHPRVVAEAGDVDPGALGRVDDELALAGRDRRSVDRDRQGVGLGRDVAHWRATTSRREATIVQSRGRQ